MIVTRTILNMSYKIIETYKNMNPKTFEFQILCRDSDEIDNTTLTEKISNLSFQNSINFQHLIDQNDFSVKNVRKITIEQVINELDNICSTIKNHTFKLTKLLDLEFSSKFEEKIIKSFKFSDEKYYNKMNSICNQYFNIFNHRKKEDIVDYYSNERIIFQRKSKLLTLEKLKKNECKMKTKCKVLYTEAISCCNKIILFERNKTYDFEIVKEDFFEEDFFKIYETETDYVIVQDYVFNFHFDNKNYLRMKKLEHLKQLDN